MGAISVELCRDPYRKSEIFEERSLDVHNKSEMDRIWSEAGAKLVGPPDAVCFLMHEDWA